MRVLHQLAGLFQFGVTGFLLWLWWAKLGIWSLPLAIAGGMAITSTLIVGLAVLTSRREGS